jgi:hypothetical protein
VTEDDRERDGVSETVALDDGVGAGVTDGNGNDPSITAVQCNANVPTALPYPSTTTEYEPGFRLVSNRYEGGQNASGLGSGHV